MHHPADDLMLAQLLIEERLQRAERARLARDARQRTARARGDAPGWLIAFGRKLRQGSALRPAPARRVEPCTHC